jgi:hypothetical protein
LIPFACGTAFGAALLAALVVIGGHFLIELADGSLEIF